MDKIKIAVTGGIGSGKSLVMQMLKEMGFPCFSCDEIYKEIIKTQDYVEKIKEAFPSVVVDGKIDRKRLGAFVFQEESKLEKLNEIAHPLIMSSLYAQMEKCQNKLIFAEIPLLFEGNLERNFDKTIVILRDLIERIESVQTRDCIAEEEVKNRMRAQFDYFSNEGEERIRKCNAIILNNRTIEQLRIDLQKIIDDLLQL